MRLLFFGTIMVLMLVILAANTIQHEKIHERIAAYHGCNNSNITYGFLWLEGEHRCVDKEAQSYELALQEKWLHSMNEMLGYTFTTLLLMLMSFAYMFFIIYEGKNDGNR